MPAVSNILFNEHDRYVSFNQIDLFNFLLRPLEAIRVNRFEWLVDCGSFLDIVSTDSQATICVYSVHLLVYG